MECLPRSLRHLYWLCEAPPLLSDARVFDLASCLPQDYPSRIARLAHAKDLVQSIENAATGRLGSYFERLYACLLTEVMGWEVLAQNVPVREAGRTLGELDFLVRNARTGEVEHHEIAVKFYLGDMQNGPFWYGPNSRDRLDLKTDRLLQHQARIAERAVTRECLVQSGLPVPVRSRVLMAGYLFYPCDQQMLAPQGLPDNHLRGYWQRAADVGTRQLASCVVLHKPDWLGPWQQTEKPDPSEAIEQAVAIAKGGSAQLFAQLKLNRANGCWYEAQRFFLVPDDWPAQGVEHSAASRGKVLGMTQ